MGVIPDEFRVKAQRLVDNYGDDPDGLLIGAIAAALLSERTAQEAEIARLTAAEAHVAKLEKVLDRLVLPDCSYHGSEIRIPCDSHSDAISRVYDARAALTPAKENADA